MNQESARTADHAGQGVPHLEDRGDPKKLAECPSAHECLEDDDTNPPRKGPNYGRVRVVVGVVKGGAPWNAFFVCCEPEVLRAPDIDVQDRGDKHVEVAQGELAGKPHEGEDRQEDRCADGVDGLRGMRFRVIQV
jgi:hypothetical protein